MHIKSYKYFYIIIMLLISSAAKSKQLDCIHEAAQCFKINPLVIKSIIWQESKNRQTALNTNKNNTIDVGIMQINTVHFKSLESLGVNEDMLRKNSCANVFSGSWILKNSIQRYGYNWKGIGNYHSKTPLYHDIYVKKIISHIIYNTAELDKVQVFGDANILKKFDCH